jgi:hypothetical protein
LQLLAFKDRLIKPNSSGYRDILMNIEMGNGHIAELLLHPSQVDEYADGEHALYELTRRFKAVGQEAGRLVGLTDEERAYRH